jgi:hypothetical protein
MLPASADAHCGNNKCLWEGSHGHKVYYHRVAEHRGPGRAMTLPLYPPYPGSDDIIPCGNLVSLEGSKTLSLREDHSAVFEDDEAVESNSRKDKVTIKGTWSYDGNSQKYAVTLSGMTTIYTVVQPKDSAACLFIKGKLEAADLRESWVSADSD